MQRFHQFIWFLLLSFATSSFGKTVILRAPSSDAKDYQAFVLSSPTYQFPSEAILSTISGPEDRESLAAAFAKAQLSFTDGSLVQASEDFKTVVAMAETNQWSEEEENVILHSYLRLAQLSHNPEVTDDWIQKAIVWAPNGKLNEKFFPPPLVEKYKMAKEQFPSTKADLSNFKPDFDYVVINGRVLDLAQIDSERLPQGPIRATFVSNTFQTVNVQTSIEDLALATIERKPWVEGSCLKPQLHWQQRGGSAKPYFTKHCAPLNQKPNPEIEIAFHPEPKANPLSTQPISTSQTKVPFYQRTWFWVGVGVVATAVVVASLAKPHTQPTSHDGF